MKQFSQYKKFNRKLNKDKKRELRNAIFFLRTAITCTLTIEATENHEDWLDDNGWAEFYEIVMEICDEVLLSNNSVFLTYIKLYLDEDLEAEDYFHRNFDTCYDWYFMDLARAELPKKLDD